MCWGVAEMGSENCLDGDYTALGAELGISVG